MTQSFYRRQRLRTPQPNPIYWLTAPVTVTPVSDQQPAYLVAHEAFVDSQPAFLTALEALTAAQNAYLAGLEANVDSQVAYLAAREALVDSIAAFLTALEALVDSQPAYLNAIEGVTDVVSAYLAALEALVDSQAAYLVAHEAYVDNQPAYLQALEAIVDSQPAYLDALESLTSSVAAYLNAVEGVLDSQAAYLVGHEAYVDSQAAYLVALEAIVDSTEAYLNGVEGVLASQAAYLDALESYVDNQPAYLVAHEAYIANQAAFLTAHELQTVSQAAYLRALEALIDSQPAYLVAHESIVDSQPAYLEGVGTTHSISVGDGYSDVSAQQLVRTSTNRVYIMATDCDRYPGCSVDGLSQTLRCYRADQISVPSSFTRQDSGDEVAGIFSWGCGIDADDVIHVAYSKRVSGHTHVEYITFDTSTNQWGTPETIHSNADQDQESGGQGYEGASLSLDLAGVPHVVYVWYDGSNNRFGYRNRSGGSWSSKYDVDENITYSGNLKAWHPSIIHLSDNQVLAGWIVGSTNADNDGTVYVRRRTTGGSWQTEVTVTTTVHVGIDNGVRMVMTADDRIHLATNDAWDGNQDCAPLYFYSDNSGGTWNSDHPSGNVGHNVGIGVLTGGDIRIFQHGPEASSDDNMYYNDYDGASWSGWAQYAAGSFDSSLNPRWQQFHFHHAAYLDVIYWDQDYANVLYYGNDLLATEVVDSQPAYLDALEALSDQQPAFLTALEALTDSQPAFLYGLEALTSSIAAYLNASTGATPVSDSQAAFLSGLEAAVANQAAYLVALEALADQQPAYLVGHESAISAQSGYLAGLEQVVENQPGWLIGHEVIINAQLAYLLALEPISSSVEAFLRGLASLTSQQPAYLFTATRVSSSQAAYLSVIAATEYITYATASDDTDVTGTARDDSNVTATARVGNG